MKHGWFIAYRLAKGTSQLDRVKFRQRLLGATITSGGGKYAWHREGVLERVPHRRLLPGVLLIGEEGRDEVLRLLREWGAEVWVREVRLTREDQGFLREGSAGDSKP